MEANGHNEYSVNETYSSTHKHDVIVLRQRGIKDPRFHLSPPLRHDTPIKLTYGAKVNGSDIIGKNFTDNITDSTGRNVRLQEVTLAQYVANSPRVATPIYPQDANMIVSFLDINLPVPGEDADFDAGPAVEIFEAGTGMGALTLHLARAIHGANPPVPEKVRQAICTAEYEKHSLPNRIVADDSALDFTEAPHALKLDDPETRAAYERHRDSRRAVLHTLDVNPTSSRTAHNLVRYFRRGMYLADVDFHVGTIRSYLSSQLALRDHAPFLSHVILDLPASQEHAGVCVDALLPGGKMAVFYPSITQVLDFVVWAEESGQPIKLDRVVELSTSTSNGDVQFRDGLGGRHWDVKTVGIRKTAAKGVVCRPKVGGLVIGGGFLAVFSRLPRVEKGEGGTGDEDGAEEKGVNEVEERPDEDAAAKI
ncbi:tRNA (adenine(58)-N(1))-methyltransferase TrmI [Colletotrichum trifolii]|uniref:tRNA (adenine(58)-N(1))-methyltransferase catalytic subunit TRM61 n=1 Tax=Colletotrichum trifolii TaxID=5466 RepID=A0A4R8RD85_COLTR|nr:tRNA (adenine(58)-N(1))-methyltransferase TrmI [Colletotrichum trifolii]